MPWQPAVVGKARLNNFRLGYIPVAMAGIRRTSVHITLGGVDARARTRVHSVSVHDGLNDTPNTCSLIFDTTPPADVADLRITVGTDAPTLLFNGTLQTADVSYELQKTQLAYPCTAVDDTARVNRKRPFGKWVNVSATTIAQALITTFAPGFTSFHVQAGLPPISITLDGSEGFSGALRQIAKLIGGYFYFEDLDLHLFTTEATNLPAPIDSAHPFLDDPPITISRDFSQLRTRVYGRGLGVELMSDVAAGDALVPIADAVSFNPAGGQAIAESQILTYTGTQLGGAGSAVGPGAAPANAPVVAAASGSGIESGVHQYAVTFVTPAGESLPSPVALLTAGLLAAPGSAPTIGAPTIGTGPDPGSHNYAVSFVTGSGETTPSPIATRATGLTPEPLAAPSVGAPSYGTGPDPGYHDYEVSFVTPIGETLPGPISAAYSTGLTPAPAAPTTDALIVGVGPDPGSHQYAVSFVTGTGETTPGSSVTVITGGTIPAPTVAIGVVWPSGSHGGVSVTLKVAFLLSGGGISLPSPPSNTVVWTDAVHGWTATLPIGAGSGVIGRRVYMDSGIGGGFSRYQDINDNTTTVIANRFASDTNSYFNLEFNGVPPTTGAVLAQVPLTAIPIGPSGTTARKLWRTTAGGSQLKLLATLANNSATTYTDPTLDSALGANAPTVNTAHLQQLPLSGIPTGDANVSARKIYRRSGGAGFKLLTTIANNSATTYLDTTPNASLGAAPLSVSTAYLQRMALSAIPTGPAMVTARNVWRTAAGGSQLKLLVNLPNNTTTVFADTVTDASLGTNAPVTNTATANQATLSSIPIGAAAVTSRKLYRTVAGGTQLKLLTTLANNTATAHNDASADATLGANVPTSDVSGLTQPTGQVNAGSTSLPVASGGAPFAATGGWVLIGSQAVRYTGVSGNTLTGIPGPGLAGSLVNTVRYGEHVDAAPVLMGVTGLTQTALKGITVNIWVQRDDLAAQAAMIALDAAQGRTSDGVYEYRISDERRAEPSLIALCDADLAQFARPIVTVTYATRDLATKAGKPIVINLTSPPIHETLTIQDVTITEIDVAVNVAPRFTVTASSVRYSLEDLLRQMAATVGV